MPDSRRRSVHAPRARHWLIPIALLVLPLPVSAQQNGTDGRGRTREGAERADPADSLAVVIGRADSARAELVQPPGSYGGIRTMDVIRLPFQLFGATLTLGLAAAGVTYEILDELVIDPAIAARDALAEVDVAAEVSTLGNRSWPAVILRYEGFAPFFAEAGYSLRQYQHYRAGVELGDSALGGEVAGTYRRMRQPHFYGVGPGSSLADRSDYAHDLAEAGAQGWWAVRGSPLSFSAGAAWERNEVGRGWDESRSDVRDVFDPATLYGVLDPTEYVRLRAGAALDLTHVRHLQVRGLSLAADWSYYDGVGGTSSAFHRVAGDARFFVPVSSRQLVALRVMGEDHLAEEGRGVPFTHLARLGDDEGLRGYTSRRFRDRALLAGQAEWRYEAWWHPGYPDQRIEGFAFVDAGTVGPSLGELSDFRVTPGMGLRFIRGGESFVEAYLAVGGGRARVDIELGRTF